MSLEALFMMTLAVQGTSGYFVALLEMNWLHQKVVQFFVQIIYAPTVYGFRFGNESTRACIETTITTWLGILPLIFKKG